MQVINKEVATKINNQIAARRDDDIVLLDGHQTNRKDAIAQIEKRQAESRNTYIDPIDLIEKLSNRHLKYKVMGSLAWTLDTACINAARKLFYGMKDAKAESIDDVNEFINEIAEIEGNESYNVDLGFEENSGTLQILSQLLVLRPQWHDKAETFASPIGMTYAPNTLEELMAKEKARNVDEDELVKTETFAKIATRKKPEHFERVLKTMLEAKARNYKKQHDNRKLTAPAVANLFSVAEYRGDHHEVQFHTLANEIQKRLLNGLLGAVKRSMEELGNWKSVTLTDYAVLCAEGFDLIDEVEAVMARYEE